MGASELTEACQAAAGEALRTVAVADFRANDYDIRYMRPDIGEQYSESDIAEIYQDIGLGGLSKQMQSDLYEPLGGLETVVYRFADGINVVGYNEDGTQAVFVGLGPDDDVVEAVRAVVDEVRTDSFFER